MHGPRAQQTNYVGARSIGGKPPNSDAINEKSCRHTSHQARSRPVSMRPHIQCISCQVSGRGTPTYEERIASRTLCHMYRRSRRCQVPFRPRLEASAATFAKAQARSLRSAGVCPTLILKQCSWSLWNSVAAEVMQRVPETHTLRTLQQF